MKSLEKKMRMFSIFFLFSVKSIPYPKEFDENPKK